MTQQEVAAALRGITFLQAVSDDLIKKLAEHSRIVAVSEGDVIFRQGEPARAIYLVIQGKVSLETCAAAVGCKRILTAGASDLLGWSPILEQDRFTATARSLEPTHLVEIDGERIARMCEQYPQLGYEFMKRVALALAKRLNATRLQMIDVYGSQMPEMTDQPTTA